MRSNVSPITGLPLSFFVQEKDKQRVFENMGEGRSAEGIIERMIVNEGLDIYDGAVYQIVLSMLGGSENLSLAYHPLSLYWEGSVNQTANIRAGFPINTFIYDEHHPEAVSSDLLRKGDRGFIFRIINAHGRYHCKDPLDGKDSSFDFPMSERIHWEDWKPVAGENAWVTMAAMHLYHKKYFQPEDHSYLQDLNSLELNLSEELARAAIILQSEIGAVRMAPMGTYRSLTADESVKYEENQWWYYQISTENNISWYAAFRMLYQVTQKEEYKMMMDKIESFMKFSWNNEEGYFYQGAHFVDGSWQVNKEPFALDVQTWAILCFSPERIDQWFGEGSAMRLWQKCKNLAGVFNDDGSLKGVGYTTEHDRLSVEWSAGAIEAVKELSKYYKSNQPLFDQELTADLISMRKGVDSLRFDINDDQSAYSYSSKRAWIPFGWYSHEPSVLSLASTAWMVLVDMDINPFFLQ